jgi:hypothetical protein
MLSKCLRKGRARTPMGPYGLSEPNRKFLFSAK